MSELNSSTYSSSNSDSSNTNEWRQWETRVIERNQEFDRMIEHAILSNLSQFTQPLNSTPGFQRNYYDRNREEGHQRLFNDYFASNPVYPHHIFRRRYRMRKPVILRIVDALTTSDTYFQQRFDATGRKGCTALQKCTAAMRVLAYGVAADAFDEYLRMGEATIRESVVKFVDGVISNFGANYLRKPTQQDIARLLYIGEESGFPGMMGSIDCMHWEWKNCATTWAGQYAGRNSKRTIILEVVASKDLWIWHAFFGTPSTCNDINVLQRSPVFNDVLTGKAPDVNFVVNGHQYNMGYYLTDGIYPQWAAFVKSITAAQTPKHRLFNEKQEGVRKDVKRAFGVLQARFAFIRRPCLIWDERLMGRILMACIIMHNMIVEDERDRYRNYSEPAEFVVDGVPTAFSRVPSNLSSYMNTRSELRRRDVHQTLKNDLIEHIWEKFNIGD